MSTAFLIAFCGFLLAMNAFSCDITLPAFWSMERALGVPIERVQLVIPVFLFCSAFGQLIFGPVSDRYGRKPVILFGVTLYAVGSLAGLAASTLEVVLVGRGLQGLGSACGVVVARAVLRDVYSGPKLAQMMALAMSLISFGPVVAPLLGFGLEQLAGWRGVFAGMTAFGGALLAAGLFGLHETNTSRSADALAPGQLGRSLVRIFAHSQSRTFILLSGIASFLILSFVTNSPRLYKSEFGLEGRDFVLLFALNGVAIIVGQLVNSRAIPRVGVLTTTRMAAAVLVVTAALIAALTAAKLAGPALFALLMFTFCAAFPIVMSNLAALVIDPHRDISGLASSVFGFFSQMTASVLVFLTLPVFAGAVTPWAIGMTAASGVVLAALALYRPRASL